MRRKRVGKRLVESMDGVEVQEMLSGCRWALVTLATLFTHVNTRNQITKLFCLNQILKEEIITWEIYLSCFILLVAGNLKEISKLSLSVLFKCLFSESKDERSYCNDKFKMQILCWCENTDYLWKMSHLVSQQSCCVSDYETLWTQSLWCQTKLPIFSYKKSHWSKLQTAQLCCNKLIFR